MDDITVAIVEDNDDIREAMRVLINGSEGFSCMRVFSNADEAVIELPKSHYDIIIMDIQLPGISGIECVIALKDRIPKSQFMMVTVFEDDNNIFDALKAGATGYILKRTSPAQILEAIRELHKGGSPMSPEIARRVVASLQKKKNSNIEILTDREKQILDLLAKGFLYKEIAAELDISYETVKKHIQNIYEKLQVQNKVEALNKAFPK
jgi:DNA-binding NarL/FixJ family response regulator